MRNTQYLFTRSHAEAWEPATAFSGDGLCWGSFLIPTRVLDKIAFICVHLRFILDVIITDAWTLRNMLHLRVEPFYPPMEVKS